MSQYEANTSDREEYVDDVAEATEEEAMEGGADTNKEVQELSAGWRNYLNNEMNLDPDTFQLAQGTLGLQTSDSSGLFRMQDAVPPSSAVGYYDSTSMSSRANNYLGLLGALLPENNPNGLRDALGDMYSSWITYKTDSSNWGQGATLLSVYKDWSNRSPIDPGRAARGEAAIMAAQNSPLIKAFTAYNNPNYQQTFTGDDGKQFTLHRYTATISDAQTAINTGASLTIDFDSQTMETDVSSTFAEGSASGFYDFFSGGAGVSFAQQNEKAAGSRVTITGKIGSFATLSAGPGQWYSSSEVTRAVNGKGDADIWDPQASAGNWDAFFGQPNGSLARFVSQLVLVSDYTLTVTSHATYSQSDFQQIKTKASFGIWPFFSASSSATHTTTYTLNSDSTLSATVSLGKGLIQIWGVNIQNQVQ